MKRRDWVLTVAVLVGCAAAVALDETEPKLADTIGNVLLVIVIFRLIDLLTRFRKRTGEPVTDPAPTMSEVLLNLADITGQIGEAVDGYRKDCEDRGYSPTAAQAMALEYHGALMRGFFAGAKA